jgi:hypothetical protein
MIIEAALLPRNLLNEDNHVPFGTQFYNVSVKTFGIPFYYGSVCGSATLESGSCCTKETKNCMVLFADGTENR